MFPFILPSDYKEDYTDEFFPQREALKSVVFHAGGFRCKGINDCAYLRPWFQAEDGSLQRKTGVLVAQVCPGDKDLYLWDLNKSAVNTCRGCSQAQLRPIKQDDSSGKHISTCKYRRQASSFGGASQSERSRRRDRQDRLLNASRQLPTSREGAKAPPSINDFSRQDLIDKLKKKRLITRGAKETLYERALMFKAI